MMPATTKDSSRTSTIERMELKPHTSRQTPGFLTTVVVVIALAAAITLSAQAQDNVFTGTNTGAASIRLAVADFKPLSADAQSTSFRQTFDATLYADLAT